MSWNRCGAPWAPEAVIAVGTALAGGPPRRSQRALLTHWAPASGANDEAFVGVGVQDAGWREPPRRETVHPVPVQVASLAAAPQSRAPVPGHLSPEGPDGPDVAGHRVVGHVAAHHAAQPPPLLRDGLVPALPELVFDLFQLRPHPLRDGDPPDLETSCPRLPADVREAEETGRLRLPGAPLLPVRGGEPPELDQPRLARVQLQGEPREPVAEVPQELPGVSQMANPAIKSSAKRTMIMSPRACRRLHHSAHRSRT